MSVGRADRQQERVDPSTAVHSLKTTHSDAVHCSVLIIIHSRIDIAHVPTSLEAMRLAMHIQILVYSAQYRCFMILRYINSILTLTLTLTHIRHLLISNLKSTLQPDVSWIGWKFLMSIDFDL